MLSLDLDLGALWARVRDLGEKAQYFFVFGQIHVFFGSIGVHVTGITGIGIGFFTFGPVFFKLNFLFFLVLKILHMCEKSGVFLFSFVSLFVRYFREMLFYCFA